MLSASSRCFLYIYILFESVLLHQLPQLAVGDAGLIGLVVDGDELGDDSCASALAFCLRCDGEADFAQMFAKRLALER